MKDFANNGFVPVIVLNNGKPYPLALRDDLINHRIKDRYPAHKDYAGAAFADSSAQGSKAQW